MMTDSPIINIGEGIRLCGGSRTFYLRMLAQFANDSSIKILADSLERNDAQSAFLAAHALKGLCAQLSLSALSDSISLFCEILRAQKKECVPGAAAQLPAIRSVYDRTLREIDFLIKPE